ncbi:hypothetical protein AVEN_202346-1 [Araneus ventricosus]|uniref:Uncharacterized protein n=1 Tax=Araneus ventricosus TaxID=182803 RepID=A0A4Y2E8L3_ARAVE|nr:hypothetical protein AVEN_202346-1 [Araneus ventricosus]
MSSDCINCIFYKFKDYQNGTETLITAMPVIINAILVPSVFHGPYTRLYFSTLENYRRSFKAPVWFVPCAMHLLHISVYCPMSRLLKVPEILLQAKQLNGLFTTPPNVTHESLEIPLDDNVTSNTNSFIQGTIFRSEVNDQSVRDNLW